VKRAKLLILIGSVLTTLIATGAFIASAMAPAFLNLLLNVTDLKGLPNLSAAPRFSLTDANGKEHKLSDYADKHVILKFWSPECKACLSELESVQESYRRISQNGDTVFLTVVSGLPREQVILFISQHAIEYPVLIDETSVSTDVFEVDALPFTYIIDGRGTILSKHVGSGGSFRVAREVTQQTQKECKEVGSLFVCSGTSIKSP
jgi:peroxiredoxin